MLTHQSQVVHLLVEKRVIIIGEPGNSFIFHSLVVEIDLKYEFRGGTHASVEVIELIA